MSTPRNPKMDRREAVKWMMSAAAGAALADSGLMSATAKGAPAPITANPPSPGEVAARGYGMDPDLLKVYKPGDLWPLTFTDAQKKAAKALADMIIPEDKYGPAASTVGTCEFIDEWVSAPYPDHARDRDMILNGLAWIDDESKKRFNCVFADATEAQKKAICDDICYSAKAAPEFKQAAQFFARYRDLTSGGYYTTPDGFKAIGYVGNIPSATFAGPPESEIKRLGLDDVANYNGLADASLQ